MVHEVALVVQSAPPGDAVAVYEATGVPPVSEGVVHDTAASPSPGVAETAVGGCGGASGVTEADVCDALLVPTMLVAVTVTVYVVPLVRPVTVHEVAPVVVQLWLPGEVVTV